MSTIGDRVRQVRQEAGLTQEAFAERLGVARGYISTVENNRQEPSDLFIKALSSIFGVQEEWLRTGAGSPAPILALSLDRLIARYGEDAVHSAALEMTKAGGAQAAIPWLPDMPIPIDAGELHQMVEYLISLWLAGDPRLKSWASVQFEQAFPRYKTELQKKPGSADEGEGPWTASGS